MLQDNIQMPLKNSLSCILAITGLSWTSCAVASEVAIVSKIDGKNVNWVSGSKASAPRIQTLLAPGDRLSVGKGSIVVVEYLADNCVIRVKSGDSFTIGKTSPCAAATEVVAPQGQATAGSLVETDRVVPTAAGVAEVSGKTGSFTRVNLGAGMVDVSVGESLNVGDEVFAGPGSSVTLYFPVPSCSYKVTAGNIYKVSSQGPCRAAGAVDNGSSAAAEGGASSISPGAVVGAVAGAAAIGGVALLALSGNEDGGNNNPATPD